MRHKSPLKCWSRTYSCSRNIPPKGKNAGRDTDSATSRRLLAKLVLTHSPFTIMNRPSQVMQSCYIAENVLWNLIVGNHFQRANLFFFCITTDIPVHVGLHFPFEFIFLLFAVDNRDDVLRRWQIEERMYRDVRRFLRYLIILIGNPAKSYNKFYLYYRDRSYLTISDVFIIHVI